MDKLKAFTKSVKIRLIIAALSGTVIILFELLKRNYAVMSFAAGMAVRPIHNALAVFCSQFDFSAAAVLIFAFSAICLLYLITQLVLLIIQGERLKRLLRVILTALSTGLAVYAGFCLLWGVYYYGTDFINDSGFSNEPVSAEQLYEATHWYAEKLNEYSKLVERDESGIYCGDREAIISRSDKVFAGIEEEMPFLKGPTVRAKAFMFSYAMSMLDFTGFFFPFTAEANVNTHFPPSLLASTVAHELSHQRGVAREQEANFTAVLACMKSGDCDYIYSGAMLAYIHMGNAMYRANYSLWEELYSSLDENVKKDLAYNNAYWKRFEAPVKEISNTVYEDFLKSYDQDLGLQSYGACVDLLVNYYFSEK